MRGAHAQDYATIRIRDVARVKSAKFLLTKTKMEFCAVRPGYISSFGVHIPVHHKLGRIFKSNDDKLNLLNTVASGKATGQEV